VIALGSAPVETRSPRRKQAFLPTAFTCDRRRRQSLGTPLKSPLSSCHDGLGHTGLGSSLEVSRQRAKLWSSASSIEGACRLTSRLLNIWVVQSDGA